MKPLVYYCRWHNATLRLRGRDDTAVWGHLVFTDDEGSESIQTFRYELKRQQLTLEETGGERTVQLDEMGTEV